MRYLVQFFLRRATITNLLFATVLAGALVAWDPIGIEEMPDFEMPWLRATIVYPGASAEDVEVLITRLVEEQLRGLSGIDEVFSTLAYGQAGFRMALVGDTDEVRDTIQKIKPAFDRAELPVEAEDPVFDRFTYAENAIIGVALFNPNQELLSVEGRRKLHEYVLAFENQLLNPDEISGVGAQRLHPARDPDLGAAGETASVRNFTGGCAQADSGSPYPSALGKHGGQRGNGDHGGFGAG